MSSTRFIRTRFIAPWFLPMALLLSDCGNELVAPRSISVSVSPTNASLPAAGAQDFQATVANDPSNAGVTWTLTGPGCSGQVCGTLSATNSASGDAVSYTAPATVPTPPTVTVTAVSVTDNTQSGTAAITITPRSIVVGFVSPTVSNVAVNAQLQFAATVANDPSSAGVTWTVTAPTWTVPGSGCSGAACGTLSATSSASGVAITYTAPAMVPNPLAVTLTATSVTDYTKSIAVTIFITSLVSVSVAPSLAGVDVNTIQQFTATLTDDASNAGVIWTVSGSGCSGAACGTLSATSSASGVAITYTAPATVPNPLAVTLTATSVTDYTKSIAVRITITSLVSVSVAPSLAGVDVNTSRQFTATLTDDATNAGVTWTVSGSGCSGPGCGTLSATSSASGVAITYSAPAMVSNSPIVTVTATSVADYTKLASATVVITTPGVLTVGVIPPLSTGICTGTPNSACRFGLARRFTAYVVNDPSEAGVNWSAGIGSVSPPTSASGVSVTYTAPSRTCGSTFVTATSVADDTKSATVAVRLFYQGQPPGC